MKAKASFAAAVLTASSAAFAGPFTSLIDFGDSLSDVGNDYAVSKPIAQLGIIPTPIPNTPGYYQGRFSNGPIWIDDIASYYGLPAPKPSYSGGTDYAYGDATSGTGTTETFIQNIRTQINSYTASHTATSTELFTVLGGADDIFNTLSNGGTTTGAQAADNIAGGIGALYADGARNVVIPNLPDLGLTPAYRGTALQADATALTEQFNTELALDLANLQTADPGLKLYEVNLFSQFDQLIANPSQYGLTDVTDSAYTGDTTFAGTGAVAPGVAGYLFYDDVHPTTTGHALIADAVEAAVPEPVSAALLVGAVALLSRRRHPRS
jgi:phospholipase/lecithinase/hemolysin